MSNLNSAIVLNTDYIKSRRGILRIFEAIIGICGIICESEGAYCGNRGMFSFYNFVVVTTLILAIIILVVCFLGLDKSCTLLNCNMTIFINDVVFTVLYCIATILMFVTVFACRYQQVARIFASLFGVCGTIVVGILAFDGSKYRNTNEASIPKSDPA